MAHVPGTASSQGNQLGKFNGHYLEREPILYLQERQNNFLYVFW